MNQNLRGNGGKYLEIDQNFSLIRNWLMRNSASNLSKNESAFEVVNLF